MHFSELIVIRNSTLLLDTKVHPNFQNKAIAMTLMALCQKSVYFEQKKP